VGADVDLTAVAEASECFEVPQALNDDDID
jgi:hypothetical protein